jgi:vancomycin resistance protein YoaR
MDMGNLLERRGVRPTLYVLAAVAAIHLVLLIVLVSLRAATGDVVLVGTSVDGRDVSGTTRAELAQAVTDRRDELLARPVEVTAGGSSLTTDRGGVGVRADVGAAVDAAWDRGRSGFYTAVGEQVGARFGSEEDVPLVLAVDDDELRIWAEEAAEELGVAPEPASVTLAVDGDGAPDLEVTEPSDGLAVDPDDLVEEVEAGYDEADTLRIDVEVEDVPAPTDDADLETAITAGERALAAEVVLTNPSAGDDLVLAPADLAAVLEVVLDEDAPSGQRLVIASEAERFRDHLGNDTLAELDAGPVEATLELTDGQAVIEGGTVGLDTDLDAAADLVVELADEAPDDPDDEDPDDPARTGELPGETTPPAVTAEDAQAALDASGLDLATEVVLTNPADGDDLVVDGEQLATVLDAELVEADDGVTVAVDADPEVVGEQLGGQLDAADADAVEASVQLSGGSVQRSGGTAGFAVDREEVASLIAELATAEDRTAELPGSVTEPTFTRELAESIQEPVSSFSTSLTPGQPRNTNIQRALEIIDGDVVLPGQRYSLNEGIGRRTEERGFVENGFIDDGELVSVTGGGVSQVGTTFMNAAWFAGIRLVTFQPHSFYFERYPEGREATLSFNTVDVVIENDSPYAILIASGASEEEAEVTFWSTPWAEVDTYTGDRTNVTSGEVRDGFDITFGRTITYPDGETRTEDYSHRYRPEDETDD